MSFDELIIDLVTSGLSTIAFSCDANFQVA
jgi:hypothetical protein